VRNVDMINENRRSSSFAEGLCLAAFSVLLFSGCAGTRSQIMMAEAPYPVSLSPVIRTVAGETVGEREMERVGTFYHQHTTAHMLWSIIPLSRTKFDLSEEIATQVEAAGGDMVANLRVKSHFNGWNSFPTIISIGILPAWAKVEVTGDIMKRVPYVPPPEVEEEDNVDLDFEDGVEEGEFESDQDVEALEEQEAAPAE
jgi:hypothetical protein